MFGLNSPQQQTQASDLSLVTGGARLTAAQHGCLQREIYHMTQVFDVFYHIFDT